MSPQIIKRIQADPQSMFLVGAFCNKQCSTLTVASFFSSYHGPPTEWFIIYRQHLTKVLKGTQRAWRVLLLRFVHLSYPRSYVELKGPVRFFLELNDSVIAFFTKLSPTIFSLSFKSRKTHFSNLTDTLVIKLFLQRHVFRTFCIFW